LEKYLVVIPTYNEAENIREVVEKVLELDIDGLEILIVDDNSPDGTGLIAEEMASSDRRIHVIHRSRKRGLGSAYVEGFKFALSEGYDLIFEMDADLSHDPSYIPDFIEKSRDYDLILGSRYVKGITVVNWPLKRLLLSYFGNLYARKVTGLPVRDATGGFKCFRREVLEAIDLDRISSEGYSFQIEMTFKAWKKGFRIFEMPIIFRDRERGQSKMSFRINGEAVWIVWKLRLLSIFRIL